MKEKIKDAFKKIANFSGFIIGAILFFFGFRIGRHRQFDLVDTEPKDNNFGTDKITDRTRIRNNELAESIARSNKRRPEIDRIVREAREANENAENFINSINRDN